MWLAGVDTAQRLTLRHPTVREAREIAAATVSDVRSSAYGDPLTVGELCEGINDALRSHFGTEVWVRGAISGLNRSANGHVYFTLIDPDDIGQRPEAILNVALFANAKFRVNAILKKTGAVRMEDGIEVAIGGTVEHYAPNGRVQLIMNMIDPSYTLGRLAESREATLKRLAAEGLLDRNRSLPLPALPLRIALVTSEGSAAEADFMDELSASGIPFEVSLFDARVQGADAPKILAAALQATSKVAVDVVAIVRGGGAKTDLVTFDHYEVAAAVAACPVPVVIGVGHEVDRSICDEVAAVSTKTPTAAAGWIVQQVARFDQRVQNATDRLVAATQHQLLVSHQRCENAQRRLLSGASTALETASRQQERSVLRLRSAATSSLASATHRLDRNDLRQRALDPVQLMARGWSITRNSDGSILHSVGQVAAGDTMKTHIADGVVTSRVESIDAAPPADLPSDDSDK